MKSDMTSSSVIEYYIIFSVFSLGVIQAQVLAPQVDMPRDSLIREGSDFKFVCRVGQPILSCHIKLPSGQIASLIPNVQFSNFEYYGDGLQAGHCGIRIPQVNTTNNGIYKCSMVIADSSDAIHGELRLTVAKAPETPDLRLYRRNQLYNENDILQATCVISNGKPVANMSWFIGEEIIYSGLQTPVISSSDDGEKLQTISQNFSRSLTWRDHGKKLRCLSKHVANEQDQFKEIEIHVKFAPRFSDENPTYLQGFQEGTEGIINFTVIANPRPEVRWYVDGLVVGQKTIISDDDNDDAYEILLNYSAEKPKEMEPGRWIARLKIKQVTSDTFNKEFRLNASNELGIRIYIIKIST